MNMMSIIHYKNIGKNDDNLQLLMSSYLAGNKSKPLYNKINELLYKNFEDGVINKKQYQNILNKL